MYSDRKIKRVGEQREKHINGGQPCDLIQLDTFWQSHSHFLSDTSQASSSHLTPFLADNLEKEKPPTDTTCETNIAWASRQELEEGCGVGEVKTGNNG